MSRARWQSIFPAPSRTGCASPIGVLGDPGSVDGWHAQVLTHERRGADVAVFTCRTSAPLPFRPGQHVSIECPYRPWQSRAYAMANAPRPDRVLEFHVRAVGAAGVSAALVDRLKPGDVLRIGPPGGSLTLDPYSRRDLVFVAGGTGLAPAKALIDELSRFNRTRWIHLFRGERRPEDFYDREGIDRIARRHPWLTVVRSTSDEPDERGVREPISAVVARHGSWADHDFYVFGSPAMVEDTLRRLDEIGVPPGRVRAGVVGPVPAGWPTT
jgi:NAD(P)H-flavin reductase